MEIRKFLNLKSMNTKHIDCADVYELPYPKYGGSASGAGCRDAEGSGRGRAPGGCVSSACGGGEPAIGVAVPKGFAPTYGYG
mgnify:FL=1